MSEDLRSTNIHKPHSTEIVGKLLNSRFQRRYPPMHMVPRIAPVRISHRKNEQSSILAVHVTSSVDQHMQSKSMTSVLNSNFQKQWNRAAFVEAGTCLKPIESLRQLETLHVALPRKLAWQGEVKARKGKERQGKAIKHERGSARNNAGAVCVCRKRDLCIV